jgi:hypothetical protein
MNRRRFPMDKINMFSDGVIFTVDKLEDGQYAFIIRSFQDYTTIGKDSVNFCNTPVFPEPEYFEWAESIVKSLQVASISGTEFRLSDEQRYVRVK